ncbi:unnamed protein product [Anisakis simplex]|uniref:Uncharacterized protein n=1 Tax=Anisakis simplex TaxID=6269 RepID=A0A3P6PKT9_ANISI|nr:unnamed protein product [Anisakis simplex]
MEDEDSSDEENRKESDDDEGDSDYERCMRYFGLFCE